MISKNIEQKEFSVNPIDVKLGVFKDKVNTRIEGFEKGFEIVEKFSDTDTVDPKTFLAMCNPFVFPNKTESNIA